MLNGRRATALLENPMRLSEHMSKHWREHARADVLAAYDRDVLAGPAAMVAAVAPDGWLQLLWREVLGRQLCARWGDGPNGRYCQMKRCWGLSDAAALQAKQAMDHELRLMEIDDRHARAAQREAEARRDEAQVETLRRNAEKLTEKPPRKGTPGHCGECGCRVKGVTGRTLPGGKRWFCHSCADRIQRDQATAAAALAAIGEEPATAAA